LQKAFGPGGGGMQEVKRNCAITSLVQTLRKSGSDVSKEEVEV